jgi:hypothetical protein
LKITFGFTDGCNDPINMDYMDYNFLKCGIFDTPLFDNSDNELKLTKDSSLATPDLLNYLIKLDIQIAVLAPPNSDVGNGNPKFSEMMLQQGILN